MRGRRYLVVAALWLASRTLVLLLLGYEFIARVDVRYYDEAIGAAHGLTGTLREYPVPAVRLLEAARATADLLGISFVAFFVMTMLVIDAAFCVLLVTRPDPDDRPGSWRPTRAVTSWLMAVPAIGTLAVCRFDLVPGALLALTLLLAARRPVVAAATLALATGVKLWPAIALPALLGFESKRLRTALAFVSSGVVIAASSMVGGNVGRLVSPLRYQADRGLQVESIAATPAMVARAADPGRWPVAHEFMAWDVQGPGVGTLTWTSTALTAMAVALILTLAVRLGRLAAAPPEARSWVVLASVTMYVGSGKVFSPQYLLWLLPIAAMAHATTSSRGARALWRWNGWLLVATVVTHLFYYRIYAGLLLDQTSQTVPATSFLVVRNVVFAWLTVEALRHAWRLTRPAEGSARGGDDPAVERSPGGAVVDRG